MLYLFLLKGNTYIGYFLGLIMALKKGQKVKVEYEGKLEDGTLFDSSERAGKPLEFTIGEKMVIPGFEAGIVEMKKGEEKEIKISPKDAYGEERKDLVKEVPKDALPKGQEPKEGMMLALQSPDGRQIPAKITKVTDKSIMIDLNHPLAGKTLIFKVKLVDIE